MPASVPPMVMPMIVIGLLVPIVLFANVAVAALWVRVTVSFVSTPTRAAEVFTNRSVAETVESYTRLVAVMPDTVSSLAVIDAVVVGWVSV